MKLGRVSSLPSRWIDTVIRIQEKKPFDVYAFLSIIIFVGSARYLLEMTVCRSIIPRSITQLPNQISFYLCIALLFSLGCTMLARVQWQKSTNVVTIGVFLGCFPPLIDTLILGPYQCFYAYNLRGIAGWPWLLYSPGANVDIGEAATLWSAILLQGLYVHRKTRSLLRTCGAILWGYGTIFFCSTVLGTTVHWIDSRYRPQNLGSESITALAPALMATLEASVALLCYLALNRDLARRIARRLIHGAPFAALATVGAAHATWVLGRDGRTPPFAMSATALPLLWLGFAVAASIVQNDHFDRDEDAKAVAGREVTLGDVRFVTFSAVLATCAALVVATRVGMVLLLLNATALVYNAPFYRAKRFFPANYKIEAIWGAGAYLLGVFTMTIGVPRPSPDVWWGAALAFGGWSLFSGIKDYKDIAADRRAGNQTWYVLVRKRGGSIRALHAGLRLALPLGMVIPPLLLYLSGLRSPLLAGSTVLSAVLTHWALGRGPRQVTVHLTFAALTLYLAGLALALLL